MKRREFLCKSGAAVVGSSFLFQESESRARRVAERPAEKALSRNVYLERIVRAQALMKELSIDALFVTPSTNMSYLLGARLWRSERLAAAIIPQSGEPEAITPAFEKSLVERELALQRIHVWEEHEDPYRLAREVFEKMGLSKTAVVGLEPTTYYETVVRIKKEAPQTRLVSGASIFDELRIVKSPLEVDLIRQAVRITEASISAIHGLLEEGLSERDVAQMLSDEMQRRGSRGGGLVQFGPNSAVPHGGPQATELRRGMAVLIDAGARVEGYTSDITRTIHWGSDPPRRFREVFDVVLSAQQAAVDQAKPGVPCQDVDSVARGVIVKAGYGRYFTHRLGHGMGMDGHERPYLVEGNTRPLARGNVVTIEPGVYLPDEFGVRIEDDFLLTENGIEALSTRIAGG